MEASNPTGKTPNDSLSAEQAVITQLRSHLVSLQKAHSLIIKSSPKNPKRIHNFRVIARKALALLKLCPGYFLPEDVRRTRKQLNRFRRITNDLRDMDIISAWLTSGGTRRDLGLLQDFALKERERAHRRLKKIILRSRDGSKIQFHLEARILFSSPTPLQDSDSPLPQEIRTGLEILERKLMGSFPPRMKRRALHRLRINCKKFRYCVEAVQPQSTDKSPQILVLEELQKRLGFINDLETTKSWLKAVIREKDKKGVGLLARGILRKNKKEISKAKKEMATWLTLDKGQHLEETVDELIGSRKEAHLKTDRELLPPE